MPAKKKSAKKKAVKKVAKKAVKKRAVPKKPRMVCFECGREMIVDKWGVAENTMICCGKEMVEK
ncbi:hypothetical protein JW933_03530 [candidate division FCPU426 bacterium]|nr:hypothetical protein [candidate division FCPU426 bacterium]